MNKEVNNLFLQNAFDGIAVSFAYCELLFDNRGKPKDYLFLTVTNTFEVESNRVIGSTVGKTLKEINPNIEQSWIDLIGSAVMDKKPIKLTCFNTTTKRDYEVSTFFDEENKFVIVLDQITTERSSTKDLITLDAKKEKLMLELAMANEELNCEINKNIKCTAELVIANKELVFKNRQREKIAKALIVENKEYDFQKKQKEKRSLALSKVNIELEVQKREKQKRVLDLVILKNKLSQEDWLKTDFLTKMSHKIRTPMNGILGFSELLKSQNITDTQRHDYLRVIAIFGDSMLVELDLLVSLFKPKFLQFEEVIQKNIYSNLSVKELAHICNMSLSSFKRKFAELYVISPIKYFTKLRLEKACELLKNRENLISNIAIEIGMYSLTTFNRSFKSYFGKSPSQFRKDEID